MTESHDEDLLRAALASGVPTPPVAPDRASGARRLARRARRRRTTGVVVATVVSLVGITVVPAVVGSDGRSSGPGPAASSSPAAVRIDCPRALGDAYFGPPEVGSDVVGARLCSGSGTGYDAPSTVIAAAEAVELAALVNRQPEVPPPGECFSIGGPGYLLVFARSDGSRQVVRGDLNECGLLTVGGRAHSGTSTVLDATLRVLADEIADEASCGTGRTNPADRSSRLGKGAIAVRYCTDAGSVGDLQVPTDALTTGVDELVDLVNSSSTDPPGTTCPFSLAPQATLLFVYGNGDTRSVHSSGCDALEVGGATRYGAGRVFGRATELWLSQRAASEPTDVPVPELSCEGRVARSPLGKPFDMTTAVLCVDDLSAVEVPADDLTGLLDSLRPDGRASSHGRFDCTTAPESLRLVGATPWGDRVVLDYDCASWEIDEPDGSVARVVPGAAGLAIQNRLIAEATGGG
jgi:hypothetical protein